MTNTPGGRVPVTKTGMGELMQAGDYVDMGEKIVKILDEPQKYVRSREEIVANFSFEETVNRYETLFREYAKRD